MKEMLDAFRARLEGSEAQEVVRWAVPGPSYTPVSIQSMRICAKRFARWATGFSPPGARRRSRVPHQSVQAARGLF